MKSKWIIITGCVLILMAVLFSMPKAAQAKQLKVVAQTKIMKVGQKKTIRANQTVKWKSLNKNLVITTKKQAKKIVVCAKKKGMGVIVAQKGKQKVTLKIRIKANEVKDSEQTIPNKPEQTEKSWEDAMKDGGEVYILDISDDMVKFATAKGGSFSKYVTWDDAIQIVKAGENVGKDALQIGQCVILTYTDYEKEAGGQIKGCTSIQIIEKYWDDVIREDGRSYIISIEGDKVELSVTKGGSLDKYFKLDDTIQIIKEGKIVGKDALQVGQCVIVDYSSHEDAVGGRLWECKTVSIIS